MITAIGLYLAACAQTPLTYLGLPVIGRAREFYEHYDVERMSDFSKRKFLRMVQAELEMQLPDESYAIPNYFKKGDPVPYMPGAGEPLINREEPTFKAILLAIPAGK